MRIIDINNNYIDNSDLSYIKNKLHFDIADNNLEELLLLLYNEIDMKNIDTIRNIKDEMILKIKEESRGLDVDVEIDDDEIAECISDFLNRKSIKNIIYQALRDAVYNNDDDPKNADSIIQEILDDIPNAYCRISTQIDISHQVNKIFNDILTQVFDES